ncbi:hypothetical protein [Methylobacter tundripaludum]|uniref:hypothetical protein n=1 Tax=Methylobacter tundripaludum TaxID=173365 RepID=UPI0004DF3895|nr:hypothetical protein [Methylobacter tundripaludum]
MSKKRFVQAVIARSLPTHDKRQAALDYAEGLWDWLTTKGYGNAEPSQPRQGMDYYRALDSRQSYYFDKFWGTYNHKQGRNEAAMRWGQLVDPTDEFYQFIIDAARKEASKQIQPGQVRKMAQGWLHEQRYNDYQPTTANKDAQKGQLMQKLTSQLNGVKTLYEAGGDEALLPEIQKLENQLREARKTA